MKKEQNNSSSAPAKARPGMASEFENNSKRISSSSGLSSQDLIVYEARLKDSLSRFINFQAYSLYFPTSPVSPAPKWLPEEKKLLVPLVSNGEVLGIFVASGVKLEKGQLEFLPSIVALCVENLLLYKKGLIDPATGLYNRHFLLSTIAQAVDGVRNAFAFGPNSDAALDGSGVAVSASGQSSFGVLLINFSPLHRVTREFGYAFGEQFSLALANALSSVVPEQALSAVAGDVSFAVFLPQSRYANCMRLGREIYKKLSEVELVDGITGNKVSLPIAIGYSCYPQDADMSPLQMDSFELAHFLLRQARLAANRAWDMPVEASEQLDRAKLASGAANLNSFKRSSGDSSAQQKNQVPVASSVLGFNEVLQKGGSISKSLPMARVEINLGLAMGAREGQHFKVYSLVAVQPYQDVEDVGEHLGEHLGNRVANQLPNGPNGPDGDVPDNTDKAGNTDKTAKSGQVSGQSSVRAPQSNLGFSSAAQFVRRQSKGEIVLLDVQENRSLAEVLHQEDPANPIAAGDYLELLRDDFLPEIGWDDTSAQANLNQAAEAQNSFAQENAGVPANAGEKSDAQTQNTAGAMAKLLRHRDFLARWAVEREKSDIFSLALLRVSPHQPGEQGAQAINAAWVKAVHFCDDIFNPKACAARYGQHSLIYFIPDETPEQICEQFKLLCTELERTLGVDAAVGIAMYPFLNYRKSDVLDNCSKALDYAMLLEKPKVGLVNSLALNIRADRYFSQSDVFAAISEYKQALLADETNNTAWTSLGVCYASIDNHPESRRAFEQALSIDCNDIMAIYNLAQVFQAQGELDEAEQYYQKCLTLNPNHVYAMLRLGQLAEQPRTDALGKARGADYEKAREYYLQASRFPLSEGAAARHLARLAISQKAMDEARERLHQALAQNPQDALALGMLAEIYLDEGDNPEIALTLARQSVALRPDYRMGWLNLGRAFEMINQPEQARQARLRASDL